MAIRVILGEDNFIVRQGVRQVLADADGVEVVAECEHVDALHAAVAEHLPDVVLTDIRMPPTLTDEGIRLAAELRASHPEIGVVVLSQYADPTYGLSLLEGGSDGRAYLLKERVHHRGELVGGRGDQLLRERLVCADAALVHQQLERVRDESLLCAVVVVAL